MNLDLLDENYPMVKPKLHLADFDHSSLTGGTHMSDRSPQTCQFLVCDYPRVVTACEREKVE
jgi:hypothetical protein